MLHVSCCTFVLLLELFRKTREGWNCLFRKTPRTEGRHKVQGSADPMFAAGLPFPVPQILEFKPCRDSGKFFQQFSWNFPGTFLQNSRKDPWNSHSPRTSKFPIRLFLLSDTVWQTVFSPFGLMKFVWWSWASGYQTNLSLCFVGKLLADWFGVGKIVLSDKN